MPISFQCTVCQKQVTTSRKVAGKVGRCPHCKAMVSVPMLDEPGAAVSVSGEQTTELSALEDVARLQAELERLREAPPPPPPSLPPPPPSPPPAPTFEVMVEAPARADDDTMECPACAEVIKARAKVCRFCGEDLTKPVKEKKPGKRSRPPAPRFAAPPRAPCNPGLAAVLAVLLPGAGHVYAGRAGAGALIFGAFCAFMAFMAALGGAALVGLGKKDVGSALGVYAILYLVWFGVWTWQIYDAYATATATHRRRR
jgi:hypothetical protein